MCLINEKINSFQPISFSERFNNMFAKGFYSNGDYEYLDDYDQIHKFFVENTVPKYDFCECVMVRNSPEPSIETEYYFFLKDKTISSEEFSDLSLKINFDLSYFCQRTNNPSFFKTLIVISR